LGPWVCLCCTAHIGPPPAAAAAAPHIAFSLHGPCRARSLMRFPQICLVQIECPRRLSVIECHPRLHKLQKQGAA
jgi:hypothetical protein